MPFQSITYTSIYSISFRRYHSIDNDAFVSLVIAYDTILSSPLDERPPIITKNALIVLRNLSVSLLLLYTLSILFLS